MRDMIDKVYELLPIIFIVIVIISLLFMGFLYKSILIPVRAILTIAIRIIIRSLAHRAAEWVGPRIAQRDLGGWVAV